MLMSISKDRIARKFFVRVRVPAVFAFTLDFGALLWYLIDIE